MGRIVYLAPHANALTGGTKIIYRHVETLVSLGYEAVVRKPAGVPAASWFRHAAPVEDGTRPLADDDILVLPEDSAEAFRRTADLPNRKVVFCQNPYALAGGQGLGTLEPEIAGRFRTFLACSLGMAGFIARYFPYDTISVAPAFADERLFRPGEKAQVIACTPRKRPAELTVIRGLFDRIHPGAAGWAWRLLETATEAEAASALGQASVFLSLARLEASSLTILEAMASGCLVAGFTGIGPREYTAPTNGLWVDEDDCEAAAHALARAAAMAEAADGEAALLRHGALATAAQWSHAHFARALLGFWRDEMGVTA